MTHRRKEWKPHFVLYEECEEFRPHDVHYEEREVAALRDELELELGFRADRELAGLA